MTIEMFSYYGAKTKVIDHYPAPDYDTVIEPFAGSARYALKYFERDVVLIDTFEKVARIWKYLVQASEKDIRSLPDSVDDLRESDLSLEERWLMGFEYGRGSARPRNRPSKLYSNWERARERIASNLYKIRHWTVIHGDHTSVKNVPATWFIDAPYQVQTHRYSHQVESYERLAQYCLSRKGQIIVCENSNCSQWLDFKPVTTNNGVSKPTTEVLYTRSLFWVLGK